MKRIIIVGMALVMMLVSIGGCFIPYEDRDDRGRHERDREHHDRDGRYDRDGDHHDRY